MSDIIPCLAIIGSLAIIFGFLAFLRYMNYRKRLPLQKRD